MGVSASAISRVTGVEVTPKNFNKGNASMLPQRLVIVGQGNDDAIYSLEKYECDGSAASVAENPADTACRGHYLSHSFL